MTRATDMDVATVLRLALWGAFVGIILQVIFYFVFQVIGYNSYLLSMMLIASVMLAILFLIGWRILRRPT